MYDIIFTMLIANILGVFIFLYIYWNRLKEDYSSEKIFNAALSLIFGAGIGLLLTKYFLNDYWFWITILTIILAEIFVVFKLKFRFFESLDALTVSFLPWLSLFYLLYSIQNSNLSSFVAFWLCLLLIFLFFLFSNFYRTFSWYKSGKIGFAGLSILGIFFTIRFLASLFLGNIISFIDKFEPFLSATVAIFSFLLLFKLSKEDD